MSKATSFDKISFDAVQDPHEVIWAQVNQFSLDYQASRLILIRNADEIKNWFPLVDFVRNLRESTGTNLVFVSNEEHPYVTHKGELVLSNGKKQLMEHVALIRSKTYNTDLVICSSLSFEPPRDTKGRKVRSSDFTWWVMTSLSANEADSNYLIARCGYDMVRVKNVIDKLNVLGQRLTRQTIEALCGEHYGDDFQFHLLALDKHKAYATLDVVADQSVSRILGHLDYMLDVLAKLHVASRELRTVRETVWKDEIPGFVVKQYYPIAKNYDSVKIRHCRKVLASTDQALRSGVKNPLDTLVALW